MSAGYVGFGKRIEARLIVLGYAKPSGQLDVERFCWDHRFGRTNVYNWISEKFTPFKDLIRLCAALECSAEWLLTGEDRAPKALPRRAGRGLTAKLWLASVLSAAALGWPSGGSATPAAPLGLGQPPDSIPLIGSRRRRLGMVPA